MTQHFLAGAAVVALALGGTPEPPREVQLWRQGDNPTDFGVHRWTARSATEVLGRYCARGNLIPLDLEHNCSSKAQVESEKDPSKPPPITAGYATLEVRAGAPWLVFRWSEPAKEQIRTGQRLYLSPEYDVDRVTGEILSLDRVALVASPATHNARVLASAMRVRAGVNAMDPMILAALRAALGAEDPAAAKEAALALLAEMEKAAGGGESPAMAAEDAPPPAEEKPMQAAEPPAEEKKDEKPAMASTRAAAPAKVAASGKGADAAASLARLEARLDAAERDRLLEREGARLDPAVRVWAATQPFAVVKGLVGATPKPGSEVREHVSATRGPRDDAPPQREGYTLSELDARMGLNTSSPDVIRRDGTQIVYGALTRDAARARIAAKAAGKAAAK